VTDPAKPDRRKYRRIQAPVLVRPASLRSRVVARPVNDISLGGLRIYSDVSLAVGHRQEIELLFADGGSATLTVEVAWIETLPPGSPALFETGLQLVQVREEDLTRIARVLGD
jgi:hypothetical protein